MWRKRDIQESCSYRLLLVEKDGRRRVALLAEGALVEAEQPYLVTNTIPTDVQMRHDMDELAKVAHVDSVGGIVVDAHGIWWTKVEREALQSGARFNEIPWTFGTVPKFAPK